MKKNEYSTVVGVRVDTISFTDALRFILDKAKSRLSGYVCVANVHMVIEAYDDPSFKQVLLNADLVIPDGMPLVTALKNNYGVSQDRVAGMDIFPVLLDKAAVENIPVFFLGSTDDVLEKIERRARDEYPNITIAGTYSPPYRRLTEEENIEIEQMVNNSGAGLLFVAFGCPKQEKWMFSHVKSIHAIMVGIGGAFPVYAGLQKRAPVWMQRLSLEWFYRLLLEPRRLFKRYFYTNTKYLYLRYLKIAE
ncbi:WecB/TagA/CpsF family glycosyltransferase [Geobacter benzoatilyticus]|uniref:WecB/TagA/CpsF family glycosyltransferase n=1 Tax=Geobacter benzoatilyticus TaxID=2815309 RepID=A0ABX7Q194_9BACT|nr:WecB/TagA/CpsF family glycosyltransferase [Geobacter benzoatilyticus]QSV44858.1 WecB/TagA/CpsF family glycosyltransferase [Geobacter benzoatilyticus]